MLCALRRLDDDCLIGPVGARRDKAGLILSWSAPMDDVMRAAGRCRMSVR